MAITSLTLNQPIQPTKPRTALLSQSSPTTTTFYTALNQTASKGIVARISITATDFSSGNYLLNSALSLRITVDGGTATTISNAGSWLRGVALGNYNTTSASANPIPQYNLTYESPIYFTQSILIEASATSGASIGSLNCLVDYSLV